MIKRLPTNQNPSRSEMKEIPGEAPFKEAMKGSWSLVPVFIRDAISDSFASWKTGAAKSSASLDELETCTASKGILDKLASPFTYTIFPSYWDKNSIHRA